MFMKTIKNRIDDYQQRFEFKLLPKLPVIISINGRAFSRITSLLDKPFDNKLNECLVYAMQKLLIDIDGSVFGYQFNDEIIIISKNDQTVESTPWYDNDIQKIVSCASSLATNYFSEKSTELNLILTNPSIFLTNVFTPPSYQEVVNYLIYKQYYNIQQSVYNACYYELLKTFDKPQIKELLTGATLEEKINLLKDHCNIDYNDYTPSYRFGTACYRIPKLYDGVVKNKWSINENLPLFAKDSENLLNILKTGYS